MVSVDRREAMIAEGPELTAAERGLVARLEAEGWQVGWHRAWVAEARRRDAHEQAVGGTRDEAFARLWDLTLLDSVEGCP